MNIRQLFFAVLALLVQVSNATLEINTIISSDDPTSRSIPQPRSDDLLEGLVPVVTNRPVEGGDGLPVLTDGSEDKHVRLGDYVPGTSGGTSTTLTYTFAQPSDVREIRVYSRWGDARAFQLYDVEVTRDDAAAPQVLVSSVRVGRQGEVYPKASYWCFSCILDNAGAVIAKRVAKLKFTFWGPGHNDHMGLNCMYDGHTARWGTALTEIDVLGSASDPQPDADFR